MPTITAVDIDYETRSAIDLNKCGVHVYFAHPSTAAWCARYRTDICPPGTMHTWVPGMPMPPLLIQALEDGATFYAHNAAFEVTCTNEMMVRKYAWLPIPVERWRCTMVQCYANGLPGSLEKAAPAANIERRKDDAGSRNMRRMAVPKTRTPCDCGGRDPDCFVCDGAGETYTWWDDPERVAIQIDYCATDVWVQIELRQKLRPLPDAEQELWVLDQHVNGRGVRFDRQLAEAAQRIVDEAKVTLQKVAAAKHGVTNLNSPQQIHRFLLEHGVSTPTLKRKAIDELLDEDDLPGPCREILQMRATFTQKALSKIAAMFLGESPDGRMRGLLQFWAAFTGRWAGRRVQPQNLKRPVLEDIPTALECVETGDFHFMAMFYDDVLSAIGDCIRGMIVADEGKELIAGDYPNIEGRVLSWLAGEQWKLDLFDWLDNCGDPDDDMYIRSFAATFGVEPFKKKDPRRQSGKIMELASGYQGAHGAYINFGATGKKLTQIADTARAAVDDEEWEKARQAYHQRGVKKLGMSEHDWTGIKVVVTRWRTKHEATTQFWRDIESAAIKACEEPGTWHKAGRIGWIKKGNTLFMQLPVTKRLLPYQNPKVLMKEASWVEKEPTWLLCADEQIQDEPGAPWRPCTPEEIQERYADRFVQHAPNGKRFLAYRWAQKKTLTHFSVINSSNRPKIVKDPKNKTDWARIATYGGMLAENATQAVARDILAYAMKRLDDAGYPIVLTVHDEAVAEVPVGHGSCEEYALLMQDIGPGYDGLCIGHVDAWRGRRYRK